MDIIRRYQRLLVWQKAMELVMEVYRATAEFPDTEKFGLTAQMRRAAVSIPSNIAEGSGRGTDREFARFLQIARGSLLELETQIMIAARLSLMPINNRSLDYINEIFALLSNLIKRMKSTKPSTKP